MPLPPNSPLLIKSWQSRTTLSKVDALSAIPLVRRHWRWVVSGWCHEGFLVVSTDMGYARRGLQGREWAWGRLGNG